MKTGWIALGFAVFFLTAPVKADPACAGKFVNPITDICWNCLFPMTIGNVPVFPGIAPKQQQLLLPRLAKELNLKMVVTLPHGLVWFHDSTRVVTGRY